MKICTKIHILILLAAAISAFSQQGCAPTYKKGKIEESLVRMCKKDYNLDIKAELAGDTLGVYLPLQNILSVSTVSLKKETSDAIQNIVQATYRIAFSSEEPINFYVITIADTKTSAEFTMTGYVEDAKRVRILDISRDEYYQRVLRELRLNFSILADPEGKNFTVEEIRMPEFLSRQVTQRIKHKFETDGNLKERFKLKKAECKFKDGVFSLTIDAVPSEYSFSKDEALEEMLIASLKEIAHVIRNYRFDDFRSVNILTKSPLYILSVPKESIEPFRKNKISMPDLMSSNFKVF